MRSLRFLILLVLVVLALLTVFVVWFSSTKDSRAISYHRQQYLGLQQRYKDHLDTILTNEPQRYALVQAIKQHRDALVKLGYLVEKDFPLTREGGFGSALDRASWADAGLWGISIHPATNGAARIAHVMACQADMQRWEQIITEFNGTTNR